VGVGERETHKRGQGEKKGFWVWGAPRTWRGRGIEGLPRELQHSSEPRNSSQVGIKKGKVSRRKKNPHQHREKELKSRRDIGKNNGSIGAGRAGLIGKKTQKEGVMEESRSPRRRGMGNAN